MVDLEGVLAALLNAGNLELDVVRLGLVEQVFPELPYRLTAFDRQASRRQHRGVRRVQASPARPVHWC